MNIRPRTAKGSLDRIWEAIEGGKVIASGHSKLEVRNKLLRLRCEGKLPSAADVAKRIG